MAFLPLVLSAVGTGVAVAGAVQQGQIAKATGNYNAALSEQASKVAGAETREQMIRSMVDSRRLIAEQRVGFANSGLEADTGTPLQVQAQTAAILRLQSLDQQRVGQTRSQSLLAQAGAERLYGATGQKGANFSAAGSLLGGGASVARDYLKLTS